MEENEKKVPEKFEKLVETIEKLNVAELAELIKVLEERFGVSAMPVMAAMPAGGGSGEAVEEKSSFDVILKDGGNSKIQVIKVVRDLVPSLGLKEAKELVDGAPKEVVKGVKKEEAEEIKKKLEEAGGIVEVK